MSTTSLEDHAPAAQRVTLYGREVAFIDIAGTGVPLLLVHGMGSSRATWGDIPVALGAAGHRVVAVDLPGHGQSACGPGDYSLGAMASTLRDLLDRLGIARVHLVGHSLGGGVCLQFAYQFPERTDAMVLVASGGLGVEAFSGLRAASLPGSELVIRWGINPRTLGWAGWVGRQLAVVGVRPHALSPLALETVSWLSEADRRTAFLATLRSVVGPRGQSVSALDKLHLMDAERVLIMWGDDDPMIPLRHGVDAQRRLGGSRLVVFPGAGHEPHVHDPDRFTALLLEHIARRGRAEQWAGSPTADGSV